MEAYGRVGGRGGGSSSYGDMRVWFFNDILFDDRSQTGLQRFLLVSKIIYFRFAVFIIFLKND
jgi:hypothetical protein